METRTIAVTFGNSTDFESSNTAIAATPISESSQVINATIIKVTLPNYDGIRLYMNNLSQPTLNFVVGTTYVFDMDDPDPATYDLAGDGNPVGISTFQDDENTTGVPYSLGTSYMMGTSANNFRREAWSVYTAGFGISSLRKLVFTPTLPGTWYYFSYTNREIGGRIVVTAATPELGSSILEIHNPMVNADSSISYAFALNVALNPTDKITLALPMFKFGAAMNATTTSCGDTTFAVSGTGGGYSWAKLTLTAGSATLLASQDCKITISSGVTTSVAVQEADFANRTATATLNNGNDITTMQIKPSPAIIVPVLRVSLLTLAYPYTWSTYGVAYTFMLNAPVDPGDKFTLTLPYFMIKNPSGVMLSTGCGNTTFIAKSDYYHSATTSLILIAATKQLKANAECTVIISTGVTSATTPQAANLATRTVGVTLQNTDDIAIAPIAVSVATSTASDSGANKAGVSDQYITVNTMQLNTDAVHAVCYDALGQGNSAYAWIDSGIRLTISKLEYLQYGYQYGYYGGYLGAVQSPTRTLYGPNVMPAINKLPQVADIPLTYGGDLAPGKWVSIVDATLNNNSPCTVWTIGQNRGKHAGKLIDDAHSGVMDDVSGTRSLLLKQSTVMNDAKTFAVCYAVVDGSLFDTTWKDSYIRLQVSKLHFLTSHQVTHITEGQIANLDDLELTYGGTIASNKWISFVDATFNNNFPCASGGIAAGVADSQHSGSMQGGAGNRTLIVNSLSLSTALTFAVCYTETGGNAGATWTDSAMRIKIAKLTMLKYGLFDPRYMKSSNVISATSRLPQVSNSQATYLGVLATNNWISLVEAPRNSYSPCVKTSEAAHVADSAHSGPLQAPPGSRTVDIPQQTLLNAEVIWAVCYAEMIGDPGHQIWEDSYIRIKLSKIESLKAHSVQHKTKGQIASVGDLGLTYTGSVGINRWISLIEFNINGGMPCDNSAIASAPADSLHSGPLQAGYLDKTPVFSTLGISTSHTFAVCYTENQFGTTLATWIDSGLRITVSKVDTISYSWPVRTMASTNVRAATNVLPQVANAGVITYAGDLAVEKFLSFVDTSINSFNPCVNSTEAGHTADSVHSGPLQAASGSKVVTIPQSTLLDASKVYAMCYAEGDGSNTDATWRDSYIRVRISQIRAVSAHLVTHTTAGHIASVGSLPLTPSEISRGQTERVGVFKLTYIGSLATNKWVSLVDATLGGNFPCSLEHDGLGNYTNHAVAAADAIHSGVLQAGSGDKAVTFHSATLDTTKTYAVCYSDGTNENTTTMAGLDWVGNSVWHDSSLRLSLSEIQTLTYGTPVRTITAVNIQDALNPLTQQLNLPIKYAGSLATGKYISLVDASLSSNNPTSQPNNPCVFGTVAAHAADATHSGVIQATAGTKQIAIPMAAYLQANMEFAVCYAKTDGTAGDASWRDSYIRVRITKLTSISAHSVTHITYGHIASVANLEVVYTGTLANNMWLSFVDHSLHSDFPCSLGSIAAATLSPLHSGPIRAGASDKKLTFSTLGLNTSIPFAVCYTESLGTSAATWIDSSLRITVSKLETLNYGNFVTRGYSATNTPLTYNRIPQMHNALLTYGGDLPPYKWISFVRHSFNNSNPCANEVTAGYPAGADHSGPIQAADIGTYAGPLRATAGGSLAGKIISIPQTVAYLDADYQYAVCYATTSGTQADLTWRDSYLRMKMSKIESLYEHGVVMNTYGHIANVAVLKLGYIGTLAPNKWMSFVDQTLNSNYPCDLGTVAAAGADSAHSGALQSDVGVKQFTVDSTSLSTSLTFAVCYANTSGTTSDTWFDTGLRMTISKVTSVSYAWPVRTLITNNAAADLAAGITNVDVNVLNVLPQEPNKAVLTYAGDLAAGKWISLVDSTLYDHNPCLNASIAGASQDTTHSGGIQAPAGFKVVTIPQSIPLTTTKVYAVCYAESTGSIYDSTWRDSYIRVLISKVRAVTSHLVTHETSGHIASLGALPLSADEISRGQVPRVDILELTYIGTLGNNKFISLVDATFNAGYPCVSSSVAAAIGDSTHSGALRAGTNNKTVWFHSATLDASKTYAVCYADDPVGNTASRWIDSSLRLTTSEVTTMSYGALQAGVPNPPRVITARNEASALNPIPQVNSLCPILVIITIYGRITRYHR